MKKSLTLMLALTVALSAKAQVYNQIDEDGEITQRSENKNFNKLRNDTTHQEKEIPKGIKVWTVDRHFGDVSPTQLDTLPHLFQNTVYNQGLYGEYNTTGNNFTARQHRIVIDRPQTDEFFFTQPYSYVLHQPDEFHFTNTLSPFTNISYNNVGNKTNGEDHLNAKFGVNAGKRLGMGFDINYAYARGFYQSQSTSHFNATIYGSYIGDRYQMHLLASTYHQKAAENGGITDDNYITHPESFDDSYSSEEIPTVLERNWNRNTSQQVFFTQRYNIGFYRKVKMTEDELKARQFAAESAKERQAREQQENQGDKSRRGRDDHKTAQEPKGRPDNARIAGDEPTADQVKADSTRIQIGSREQLDSLLALQARQDSIDATMKQEYVPVTSFIHTLDVSNNSHIYQAYNSPTDYYANTYYNYRYDNTYGGDSIYDRTKYFSMKNTVAIALLEGFNKYAKGGLKAFAAYEMRRYQMPELADEEATAYRMGRWNKHNLSIGGQLSKRQGRLLHYNLTAEAWLAGMDAGSLNVDFDADINLPLFGDTVQVAAKGFFHRSSATFFQNNFHSKHLWWDNDFNNETRTHVEGVLTYPRTHTQLRAAIEEIQNYIYFGTGYDATTNGRTGMTAGVYQASGNINLMTLQLRQDFRLGPLNWENIVTYQSSSNKDVLPVPALNLFTNLYFKFKVVRQLSFELGADCYFFTKYYAPDYCPQLSQFAVQTNADSRVKLGGYPFIDVYANMHLKRTRFFVMMSHVNAGNGNYFLAPHYPMNGSKLRMGLSWNFFN